MPSDGDKSIASEKDYAVERELKNEENSWSIGILDEFLSSAVTEEKSGNSSEP